MDECDARDADSLVDPGTAVGHQLKLMPSEVQTFGELTGA